MIGQFTCIEEKSGVYNERPWSHLILHTVYADGKVAQIKVKRDLFMKLNGNIPDNECKKIKWDISTLTTTQNGKQIVNLSYMEKA